MAEIKVTLEETLVVRVTTPDKEKSSDLYDLFKKFISKKKGMVKNWKISEFLINPGSYGFKVTMPDGDERSFRAILWQYCNRLKLSTPNPQRNH